MLEAYVVILCNSYSMNKVQAVGASTLPWNWVWPARLRRLAVSSPGRRLRTRFAAVSRQGAPRSKSTRLPDPAASPHQFLHYRSEYKVFSDTTIRLHVACNPGMRQRCDY